MKRFKVVYISLSGNTHNFIEKLDEHLKLWYDITLDKINVYELVKNEQPFNTENEPFVTFLPTYLEGGDGQTTGTTEVLTTPLKDYLKFNHNYQHCLGVIGSGNKNFNEQYCLTAKQYSEAFNFPVLDTFELRGTNQDVERIAKKIATFVDEVGESDA